MTTDWHPYLVSAFESVFRPWMDRRIAAVHVRGDMDGVTPTDRVILAANHVSWWDGFFLRELHRGLDVPLFTLMQADRLARFPFFAKMGVIGLTGESADVLRALRRLQKAGDAFWLSYFPQGRIWPSWKRPLGFQRGIELFSQELAPCTVVPVALHVEPLTAPAPSVFIGVGRGRRVESGDRIATTEIERAVEELLDELHEVLADAGEEAGAAWTIHPNNSLM